MQPRKSLKNTSGARRAPPVPDPRDRPAGRPERGDGRPRAARAGRASGRARSPRCSRRSSTSTGSASQVRLGGPHVPGRPGDAGAGAVQHRGARRAGGRAARAAPAVVRARFHLSEESEPASVARDADGHRRGRDRTACCSRRPTHPRSSRRSTRSSSAASRWSPSSPTCRLSRRVAYVGIDNRAAGATAAYLLTRLEPAGRHRAGHAEQLGVPGRGGARGRASASALARAGAGSPGA